MRRLRRVVTVAFIVCTISGLALLLQDFRGAGVLIPSLSFLALAAGISDKRPKPVFLVLTWTMLPLVLALPLASSHQPAFTPIVRFFLLSYLWFAGFASWEIVKASRALRAGDLP